MIPDPQPVMPPFLAPLVNIAGIAGFAVAFVAAIILLLTQANKRGDAAANSIIPSVTALVIGLALTAIAVVSGVNPWPFILTLITIVALIVGAVLVRRRQRGW